MANYNVDIAVAVKAAALNTFNQKLKTTEQNIDNINTLLRATSKATGSFNDLSQSLGAANLNLNAAVRGTRSYKLAILQAARAERELNRELNARSRIQSQLTNSGSGFAAFSQRADQLSGRPLRTEPLRVTRQRRKGLGQYSSPIGPSPQVSGAALPPNFNQEIAAATAAARGVEALVTKAAQKRKSFAEEINQLELGFNKKLETAELNSRLKKFKSQKELNEEVFDDIIKQDKKYGKDFDRRLRNRTEARKKANRKVAEDQKKLDKSAQSAALGIGFPLLFGGGPGSIAGGLAGSAFGFGGQILGSAIGQQLDKLGSAALDTAKAFDDVASNLDVVLKKLGETNTTIGGRATFLAGEGFTNQAAAAVQLRAQETLGNKRVQQLKELAKSAREFDNALERLGMGLQSFITPLVKGLADAVTGTQPKAAPTGEQKALGDIFITKSSISALETVQKLAIERGATLSKQDKERLQALKAQLLVQREKLLNVEGETEAERLLLELSRKRLAAIKDIGEREVSLAQRQLTERRDVLAADQGSINVKKAQNELDTIKDEINANFDKIDEPGAFARNQVLQDKKTKAEVKLGLARANAANSVLKAERQITKETETQAIQADTAYSQRLNVMTQIDILGRGTVHTFDAQFKALVEIQRVETSVLKLKQKQERVDVREGELKKEMLIKQKEERDLLGDKQLLQRAQAKAAHAERLDREQAIKDTRAIRTLEAEISAERQKRATDPEYMMSFAGAGLGFFSGSSKLEADQLADRAAKSESFNEQIAKLQQRQIKAQEDGASRDFQTNLGYQLEDLENLRDTYQRLQPGIDEAALAQARFNDALAITTPLTDSLFDSLVAVVEGTKTAEQAFADFLRSIADMLMQAAKQMIAQYIAIGIARMFAGMGGGGDAINTDSLSQIKGYSGVGANTPVPLPIFGQRALGGSVSGNRPYLVGERGPELFVPGAQGNIVPNNAMGSANVTVNVDASGSSVEGDSDQAGQLGKMLGAAVQAELIKQKRPGGLLA